MGKAFGNLLKEGILSLDLNKQIIINCLDGIEVNYQKIRVLLERAKSSDLLRESLTNEELSLISNFAKKKGADSVFFKITEKLDLTFRLSGFGLEVKNFLMKNKLTGDEITKLTPEILKIRLMRIKNLELIIFMFHQLKLLLGALILI